VTLSPASVLTITAAVEQLGGRAQNVRKWLRSRGLVIQTAIGERVIWGRVLEELESRPPDETERPALRRAGVRPRR